MGSYSLYNGYEDVGFRQFVRNTVPASWNRNSMVDLLAQSNVLEAITIY